MLGPMPDESFSLRGGVHGLIEGASLAIELLAIAIIVVAIVYGTVHYLLALRPRPAAPSAGRSAGRSAYDVYRERVGRALLLGLEILVAADIIRTVALEPTLGSIASLGLLVLIRTFLSWSLVVEIEGHWPWQVRRPSA
jgi:uncharacterized membrane protein